jgi:hypothetical protein
MSTISETFIKVVNPATKLFIGMILKCQSDNGRSENANVVATKAIKLPNETKVARSWYLHTFKALSTDLL